MQHFAKATLNLWIVVVWEYVTENMFKYSKMFYATSDVDILWKCDEQGTASLSETSLEIVKKGKRARSMTDYNLISDIWLYYQWTAAIKGKGRLLKNTCWYRSHQL